ncbi:hypothetical protein SK128_018948 [Halocaridina rubra]|uniref:Uncharacterized protein n=1 Tax=Halocaridina rubra TaxID=373956 RepID=A0AAN8WYB5_HALRR
MHFLELVSFLISEVNHVYNDLTPDSGLTSDTLLQGQSLEILEAYTPSTLPLGSYAEISPYATFRMPGENKTPPPPPLPSRAEPNARLMTSLTQPVASVVESGYSRVKRKGQQLPEGGERERHPQQCHLHRC